MSDLVQYDRTPLAGLPLAAFALLVAAAASFVYWPITGYPLVNFDDPRYISLQPHVLRGLSWDGVAWALQAVEFSNWHPLTWISYMADASLAGATADTLSDTLHRTNLLLHLLNSVMLLWLLRRMTGAAWKSSIVALLFAVYPTHVESVAWVSERKDLLSTLFGLLALAAYVAYVRRPRAAMYLLLVMLYGCSLMSKPMLVTLPALLLLLDVWPLRRWRLPLHRTPLPADGADQAPADGTPPRRLLIEKLPLLAMAAASAAIAYYAQQAGGAIGDVEKFPLATRLLNALASYGQYLLKTLWPTGLGVFYPYPAQVDLVQVVFGLLLLAGASLACLYWWRRPTAHRDTESEFSDDSAGAVPVGWFWFVGTLLPVIGLVQIGRQSMADRYLYFPSIGLYVALVWGAAAAANRFTRQPGVARALAGAALIIASLLALQARRQVALWQSSETLWRNVLAVAPPNYYAHASLGLALAEQKREQEAVEQYLEAIRLNPEFGEAYGNLGLIYEGQGRHAEAEAAYRKTIDFSSLRATGYLNLGSLYSKTGRATEAEAAYKKAIQNNPDYAAAYYNLGLLYAATGRPVDAAEAYRRAAAIEPNNAEAHRNLAMLLTQQGRAAEATEAIEQYNEWLRLEPQSAVAHNNLANALARSGNTAGAIAHYRAAIQLDAKFVDPLVNLGTVQMGLGQRDEAAQLFEAALRLDPANAAAASRLRTLRAAAPAQSGASSAEKTR